MREIDTSEIGAFIVIRLMRSSRDNVDKAETMACALEHINIKRRKKSANKNEREQLRK